MELGDYSKYVVKEVGTIWFYLESIGFFEDHEVLWVPKLKKNLLLLSVLEDIGFPITIKKGKVLRHPKGAIPNTIVSSWVREGNLYSLKGKPIDGYKDILDHESMPVVEEK